MEFLGLVFIMLRGESRLSAFVYRELNLIHIFIRESIHFVPKCVVPTLLFFLPYDSWKWRFRMKRFRAAKWWESSGVDCSRQWPVLQPLGSGSGGAQIFAAQFDWFCPRDISCRYWEHIYILILVCRASSGRSSGGGIVGSLWRGGKLRRVFRSSACTRPELPKRVYECVVSIHLNECHARSERKESDGILYRIRTGQNSLTVSGRIYYRRRPNRDK